jgi:hypothetical protein
LHHARISSAAARTRYSGCGGLLHRAVLPMSRRSATSLA